MSKTIFRDKSMDKITSPEQMNDYIRVSNPSVWMILSAVIILLVGVCVWGVFGRMDTVIKTGGVCFDGQLTVYISESDFAKVDDKTIISVGGNEYSVTNRPEKPVRTDENTDPYLMHLVGVSEGDWVYSLEIDADGLPDGTYALSVVTERVRPLDFVLN